MKKYLYILLAITYLVTHRTVFSQLSISGIVNDYTSVLSVFDQKDTNLDSVKVKNASFFSSGDIALLIQMKGAILDTADLQKVQNINNAGKYEILLVKESLTADSLVVFSSSLMNNYDAGESVQLIRIPYADAFTIDGTLEAYPWDGEKGGIIALIANHSITLQANINASFTGFMGATPDNITYGGSCAGEDAGYEKKYFGVNGFDSAGRKGEGIISNNYNYHYGVGRSINGGGGGNGKYAGGFGGGNFGDGGWGGYEINSCPTFFRTGLSPTLKSAVIPGYYNNIEDRIFLGGGGGSGTQGTISHATKGGNGGGIIILLTDSLIGNDYAIRSDGESVTDTAGLAGAGGGGAGGTILLDVTNPRNINVSAQGGHGGAAYYSSICTGPGGGGGGGLLWYSGGAPPDEFNGDVSLSGGDPGNTNVCGTYGATTANDGNTLFNLVTTLNGFLFNYIYGDQTICQYQMPDSIYGSTPKGGNGNYTYLWKKRTTTSNWDTAKGGTYNEKHYHFTAPLSDTFSVIQYKRFVYSLNILDSTSGSVSINVVKAIENNSVVDHQDICEGLKSDTLIGTVPTGGTSFYNYSWEDSTNQQGWSAANGIINNKNYFPGVLFDTTFYRRKVSSGPCTSYSDSVIINVLPSIEQNIITSSHHICENQVPDTLTGSIPIGGNNNYDYLWEKSLDNTTWDSVQLNTKDYIPNILSDTTFFRRIVISGPQGCCKDTTDNWTINLLASITNNMIIADTNMVCKHAIPEQNISGSLPQQGGGQISYEYEWFSSHDSINWEKLNDKQGQDLDPEAIPEKTFFKRVVNSYTCSDTSNITTIDVYSLPNGYLHNMDTMVCSEQPIELHFNISGDHGPWTIHYFNGDTTIETIKNITQNHYETIFPVTNDSVNSNIFSLQAVYDSLGCKAQDTSLNGTVEVKVFGWPQTNAGDDKEVCDSTTLLEASDSYGYGEWSKAYGSGVASFSNPFNHQSRITIHPLKEVKYGLIWQETNWQCVNKDTVEILFYGRPDVNAGENIILNFNTDTTLSANSLSENETGTWSLIKGQGTLQDENNNNTYVYNLSDKEKNILKWSVKKGICPVVSDSISITIDDIVIPSGFSPNNDNINDHFEIKGLNNAESNHLVIFDQWGNIIYEKNNYNNNWDGRNTSGEEIPEGTYFYVLEVKGNLERKKSGYIILKRNPGLK